MSSWSNSFIQVHRPEGLLNDASDVLVAEGVVERHTERLKEVRDLLTADLVAGGQRDSARPLQIELPGLIETQPQLVEVGVVEIGAAACLQSRRPSVLLRDDDVRGGKVVAEQRHRAGQSELDVEQPVASR